MLTYKNIIFISLLGCFLIIGCLKLPEVTTIKEVSILGEQNSDLKMEVVAVVNNPNKISATINKIDSKIYINDKYVGFGIREDKITIKAKSETDVSLMTNLELPRLSKIFPDLLSDKKSSVTVKGKYEIKTGKKSIVIRTDSEQEVNFKEELNKYVHQSLEEQHFKLSDFNIQVEGMSLNNTSATTLIEINNSFNIDYELKNLELDLFLGKADVPFGTWSLKTPTVIPANESKKITAKILVKNKNALAQVLKAGMENNPYVIAKGNGTVSIAEQPFVIPLQQKMTIQKSLDGFWKN